MYEEAAGFFELQQHEVAMARTAAPTSSDTKLRMEEAVIQRNGADVLLLVQWGARQDVGKTSCCKTVAGLFAQRLGNCAWTTRWAVHILLGCDIAL